MNENYTSIYDTIPTASQSENFAKSALDYYDAGITDSKEIGKSMKFEKELREQMIDAGTPDKEAEELAKKQAIVISKIANDPKITERLTNEGKRKDLKEEFVRTLKASGMDEKGAVKNAEGMIGLLMKRKGLSPD